jgi:molybdenum cofactor cytidylyltransferase
LLVTLADMPFVPESHLRAVARAGVLTASSNGIATMPPALFSRENWPDLLATSGDRGGAALLGSARVVAIDPAYLRDIDTAADLPASK